MMERTMALEAQESNDIHVHSKESVTLPYRQGFEVQTHILFVVIGKDIEPRDHLTRKAERSLA